MKPYIFAISGIKNSGKTTLAAQLISRLSDKGLKIATIKHDGHDFEADHVGTDSYTHHSSGAYGTAVFSANRFMIHKECHIDETTLFPYFTEADIILLEGFKGSTYPKLEIIRRVNDNQPVANTENLVAYVSDCYESATHPVFDLNAYEQITDFIYKLYEENKNGN